MTFEQIVARVRASENFYNLKFTLPELGDGLNDALKRLQLLEHLVKQLQGAPPPSA